jgi:hypothetical protein
MLARAVFNLPIAAAYRAEARTGERPAVARAGMVAMLGLSAMDTATAVGLHSAESPAGVR